MGLAFSNASFAQSSESGKASRLSGPVPSKGDFGPPVLGKSDLSTHGLRGDLQVSSKGDRQSGNGLSGAVSSKASMAAASPGEINLLDLLLPTDPHVDEESSEQVAPAPRPVKRKRSARKQSRAGKPIGIAQKKGRLVLNRFHTMKLEMEHRECREFPGIVLADYKLPASAVETLADNMAIVQKQMCASNGLVVFTCYQNQATISLRRARPDDGCKR